MRCVRVRVSASPAEAAHFGRRAFPPLSAADTDDPARQQLVTGLLRDATGADELIITTITQDHADRVRSYQLLAEEWRRC